MGFFDKLKSIITKKEKKVEEVEVEKVTAQVQSYEQIKELISVDTLKTMQLLGFNYKAPIIIEETKNMIFFPTSSPRFDNCMWISLKHIKKYDKYNNKSIVSFKGGKTLTLNMSYNSLENQIFRATRLESVLNDRICNKK